MILLLSDASVPKTIRPMCFPMVTTHRLRTAGLVCVLPLSDCFVSFPSFLPLCVYVSAFPFDIFLSFPLGKGGWEVTHGQGLMPSLRDCGEEQCTTRCCCRVCVLGEWKEVVTRNQAKGKES